MTLRIATWRQGFNFKALGELMAKRVAAGEKDPSMKDLMVELGYPEELMSPGKIRAIKQTLDYRAGLTPYLVRLKEHQEKILMAMEDRDLKDEQYRTLVEASSKITHDVQLLSGGKTENVGIEEDRKSLRAVIAAIQLEE